jgi:hypothetical protein
MEGMVSSLLILFGGLVAGVLVAYFLRDSWPPF